MYYKLEKPELSKKDVHDAISLFHTASDQVREVVSWAEDPQYKYWDTIKHKAKALGLKPELLWQYVKIIRTVSTKLATPVRSVDGSFFRWNSIARFDAFFHEVDMSLGGTLKISGVDLDARLRQEFITRGVMEEAIASSQLEGANTARKVARQMLLEGRKPKTKSEKMIVNNYKAMMLVEQEYKNQDLTLDVLLKLHEVLTIDTLEDPADCARLRTKKDDVVHVVDREGTIYHTGPEPAFLKTELIRLIDYANKDTTDKKQFTHPVVKAIILHFWIGYLHPFIDGNGRLARTIFYWSLLRDGYWGFTYLPISRVIKESSTQYGMAYVYTEQDDNDFTYFLDYNVRKIEQALNDFKDYVKRKADEHAVLHKNLIRTHQFNDRQIRVLQYLHANMGEYITTRSYRTINNISHPTAVSDVSELVAIGFLQKEKIGREVKYYATKKIESLFR